MPANVNDLHECKLPGAAGGVTSYWFRTPDSYDPAKMRRILALQGVRRPSEMEFEVSAFAGVAAMAAAVGDLAEGARQRELLEDWYRLLKPIDEDEIDEPDFEKRAAQRAELEKERLAQLVALQAEALAIEANLERHWPPYRELVADRNYWDDISRIDVVRLLLARIGEGEPLRDKDGLVAHGVYQSLPRAHRQPLATFALRLLAPDEALRKN